jgi:hypothetical protein
MKRVRALTRKMLRAELIGSDTCTLGQLGLSVHSRSPVLKLARELIARGIDPRTRLEVFRGDILALKVRSIDEAAGLCVAEGDYAPRFAAALEPEAFRRAPADAIKGPRGYRGTPEPKKRAYGPNLDRETALHRPRSGSSAA